MNIQVFVFNYAHFEQASRLFYGFTDLGFDTYWINCASPADPPFPATDKIIKLPNVYYSGQWNEAVKRATGDVLFLVNADVRFRSLSRVMYRCLSFYRHFGHRAGIYAPNLYWTPWTYNPHLCPDLGNGMRQVPCTDSTVWAVRTSIARKVGSVDLTVNRLGWGIEIVAAYYCSLEKKYVVRDYGVKCDHPMHTAYNRGEADGQFRNWIKQIKVGAGFWGHYHSRERYGFGSGGDLEPGMKFPKMMC